MTPSELNRAVAAVTGESIREISKRGFGLLTQGPVEAEPRTADWDEIQAQRQVSVLPQRRRNRVSGPQTR